MTGRFSGRTVIVTGATGIGAATARRVAGEGGSVFVVAREEDRVAELVASLPTADGLAVDLTDEDATVAAFDRAVATFGPPDGILAVAGASGRRHGDGPIEDIPLSGWEATLSANLTPMFLTAREGIRRMDEGGSVVVVTSVLADHPSRHFVTHAYAAAKSAVTGFVRSLAAHVAARSIRVNGLAAGLVDTPMAARAAADPGTVAYARNKQPLSGGLLPPESVAAAAGYLLSDDSLHVTGQILAVDGGWGVVEA